MANEIINTTNSPSYQKMQSAAHALLDSMNHGSVKRSPFAYQVAEYVITHPEEAKDLAESHYQSFFVNRQKYMVNYIGGSKLKKHIMEKYGNTKLEVQNGL